MKKQNEITCRNNRKDSAICRNEGVSYCMDKPKLNFRFHNPNKTDVYLKVFLDILLDVNMQRIAEEVSIALEESENQNDIIAKNSINKGE